MPNTVEQCRIAVGAQHMDTLRCIPVCEWTEDDLAYHAPGYRVIENVDDLFVNQTTGIVRAVPALQFAYLERTVRVIRNLALAYSAKKWFFNRNPLLNPILRVSPRLVALAGFGEYLMGEYDESFGLTKGSTLPNTGAITSDIAMRFYCPVRDTLSYQPSASKVIDASYFLYDRRLYKQTVDDDELIVGPEARYQHAINTATMEHMLSMPPFFLAPTTGYPGRIYKPNPPLPASQCTDCDWAPPKREVKRACIVYAAPHGSARTLRGALHEVNPEIRVAMSCSDVIDADRVFEFSRRNSICSSAARALKVETRRERRRVRG